MHKNKWKWKLDNSKPMGFSKSSAKGKVIATRAYFKKQKKNNNN